MSGICTDIDRDSGGDCTHRSAVVGLDGANLNLQFDDARIDALDWANGIFPSEWASLSPRHVFALLGVKYARVRGISFDTLVGRVVNGEEATNVKQYTFCGPGAAITMTNMRGAGNDTYANVCPGTNGEWILVDMTGCTEFRPMLTANLVSTGPFRFRIVRDSDSAVFYESPSIAQTGERELDPGWVAIPGGFSGQEKLRIQAKSAQGTDDPVIRRAQLGVK